jgi:hypothetical protein
MEFTFDVGLLDGALTIPEYRQSYTPRPELRSTGVFPSAYLTGASGKRYHGQRAFDDKAVGQTHIYSFCQLQDGDTSGRPPELWERPRANQMHPYEYRESDGEIRFVNDDTEVVIRPGRWTWRDGGGRWELEVENLGEVGYFFWVPVQEDIPICQYHRGEMGRCTGQVNGDPVHGFTYLDYTWGPIGIDFQFFELPLIRKMNKAWVSYYAAFEDGGYVTGAARQGRSGVNWSMAYVVDGGVARVHSPTTMGLEYNDQGIVREAVLDTGHEQIRFVQDCSTYWPLHTIGRVAEVSGRAPVTDSWVNLEWMPDNADEMFEAWNAGRVDAEAAAGMHIAGERMVIPGVVS